jgi:hypothetical protein
LIGSHSPPLWSPSVVLHIASWCRLYFAAKPSHVGVDVDGPACLPPAPSYDLQPSDGGGQGGMPSCRASSCLVTAVGGDAFSEDVKPPGLDIRWSVNRMATCAIGSYMEHIIFTRTCLPYVRVIMVFIRVPMVEPLSQTVMGWTPTLECMLSLSGAHGLLLSRPISPSDKYHPLVRP